MVQAAELALLQCRGEGAVAGFSLLEKTAWAQLLFLRKYPQRASKQAVSMPAAELKVPFMYVAFRGGNKL